MVIYEGPSRIDGAPIVAIATVGSQNPKTGNMVQTWIMRRDLPPVEASKRGLDESVCGDCPQRHALGGGCYVVIGHAPRSVWEAWKRGRYDRPSLIKKVKMYLHNNPVRIGAYGDPCAVPLLTWIDLLGGSSKKAPRTGYTHLWRKPENQLYRALVMASCDNLNDYKEATSKGWRAFLATTTPNETPNDAIQCAADSRMLTCERCRLCDGTKGAADKRKSIWIAVHGARTKHFNSLNIIQ